MTVRTETRKTKKPDTAKAPDLIKKKPAQDPGNQAAEKCDTDSPKTKELLGLVEKTDTKFFPDQRGDPYARVEIPDGHTIIPVKGCDFDDWLSRMAWQKMGWALGTEALKTAKRQLEFKAKYDSLERPLYVRVANHEDAIWVDLNGRHAVRISLGKWEIVKEPPILFRTYPHQSPLPEPLRGGDPWKVFSVLNFHEEWAKLLYLVWMVTGYVPGIPIPAMVLFGPPGSIKTTTLKIAKRLIDPGHPEVHGRMRKLDDFAQLAFQNRMLILDNLSSISDDLSDTLCGAVTGEGAAKRELYTNENTVVHEYRSIIGLAGVTLLPQRSDLVDRSIILRLPPVPSEKRIMERDLNTDFEKIQSEVLGGLFDALSNALMIERCLDQRELPRMADFASIGSAVAEALGSNKGAFLSAYAGNVSVQHETILESDLVAQILIKFMESRDRWEGIVSDLRLELESRARAESISTRAKEWPRSSNHLSGKINYLEDPLKSIGIVVERPPRSGNRRPIIIRKLRPDARGPNDDRDDSHDDQD